MHFLARVKRVSNHAYLCITLLAFMYAFLAVLNVLKSMLTCALPYRHRHSPSL